MNIIAYFELQVAQSWHLHRPGSVQCKESVILWFQLDSIEHKQTHRPGLKSYQASGTKSFYNSSFLCFSPDHASTQSSNSSMITANIFLHSCVLCFDSRIRICCCFLAGHWRPICTQALTTALLQAPAPMTVYAQSNNGCNSTFSWPHCMFPSQVFTHRDYWWFSQSAL